MLFRRLVLSFTRNYSLVQVEDYLQGPGREKLRKPPAAIVFDDGYRDFLLYALPILRECRCPASVFVVTDCADNGYPVWTYRLDYLLLHTRRPGIALDHNVPENIQSVKWGDTEKRLQYAGELKKFMKTSSDDLRRALMDEVLQRLDDVSIPAGLMMDWNDLKEVSSEGVRIGSHSVSHPALANVQDEAVIRHELSASARVIESKTGKAPEAIAYPFGSLDTRVTAIAREAGYKVGLAVGQRRCNMVSFDPYAVPRIELYNEPFWKSKARIILASLR